MWNFKILLKVFRIHWSYLVLMAQTNKIDEVYNKSRPLRWSREMDITKKKKNCEYGTSRVKLD